jgi:hypothetical protein
VYLIVAVGIGRVLSDRILDATVETGEQVKAFVGDELDPPVRDVIAATRKSAGFKLQFEELFVESAVQRLVKEGLSGRGTVCKSKCLLNLISQQRVLFMFSACESQPVHSTMAGALTIHKPGSLRIARLYRPVTSWDPPKRLPRPHMHGGWQRSPL